MIRKLTNPSREAIRLTKFWQEFGPNTYPLDMHALVSGAVDGQYHGIKLKVKFAKLTSIEGTLVKSKHDNSWTILLNQDVRNRGRMRFTFAHELGHFMCHRHLKDEFSDTAASVRDYIDVLESEANTFASWLLMPANLVRNEFEALPWSTETLLAMRNRFDSSLQACAIRLIDLSTRPRAFIVSRDGMILWSTKGRTAPFLTAYRSGDELPVESDAAKCFNLKSTNFLPKIRNFSWNSSWIAEESHYLDSSGQGYQYTCIEFERDSCQHFLT
jgi:Zn-dependent peptidase ImmA (M78 family)